jgi:hypothetical protein
MMRRVWDALFIVSVATSLTLATVIIYNNIADPSVCWTTC